MGERVIAGAITPCGQCRACLSGQASPCGHGGEGPGHWMLALRQYDSRLSSRLCDRPGCASEPGDGALRTGGRGRPDVHGHHVDGLLRSRAGTCAHRRLPLRLSFKARSDCARRRARAYPELRSSSPSTVFPGASKWPSAWAPTWSSIAPGGRRGARQATFGRGRGRGVAIEASRRPSSRRCGSSGPAERCPASAYTQVT